MATPLIETISASTAEVYPYPEVGSDAKISFGIEDGDNIETFATGNIYNIDFLPNKTVGDVWSVKGAQYEVTLTDNRITFFSPLIKGMFTPTTSKKGKCTAGHLYYKDISQIEVGHFNSGNEDSGPFFSVGCFRSDDTVTSLIITSRDETRLRALAVACHSRLPSEMVHATDIKREALGKNWEETAAKRIENWTNFVRNISFAKGKGCGCLVLRESHLPVPTK